MPRFASGVFLALTETVAGCWRRGFSAAHGRFANSGTGIASLISVRTYEAHKLRVDRAKAPGPADSDVHVTGIAASDVDVFFCLAESASVRGFRCLHTQGAQE